MRDGKELKTYYIAIWHEMLSSLLGWTPLQVMQWLDEHIMLSELDNPDDFYYHEPPQYWILTALIPESYQGHLQPKENASLRKRLLLAFEDEHHYEFPLGTDWRPFRQRIEQILAEFDEHLPGNSD